MSKKIIHTLAVLYFFSNCTYASELEMKLGHNAGGVVTQCYGLIDLSNRFCPKLGVSEVQNCVESSLDFLPPKYKKQIMSLLNNQIEAVRLQRLARHLNDTNFHEILKQDADKELACAKRMDDILYYKEDYINKAKKVLQSIR